MSSEPPQSLRVELLFLLLREPDFRPADRTDGNDLQPGRFSHVPFSRPGFRLNEASYVNRQFGDGLLTGQTLSSGAGHPAETIHPVSLKPTGRRKNSTVNGRREQDLVPHQTEDGGEGDIRESFNIPLRLKHKAGT